MNDQKDEEIVEQTSDEQIADDVEAAAQELSEESEVEAENGEQGEGDLSAALDAAQAEIAKLKDGYLRAKAEEDNIRRRSEKEVASARKFAIEGFAKELLNVHDSLRLASAVEIADDAEESVKGLRDGVEITLKQLESSFSKFSLTAVLPEVGDKLDPNVHQAMSMVESEDVDSGHIVNVIQSGFTLNDRLLRPAMVVVAK